MSNSNLVSIEDLKEVMGYERSGDVEKKLIGCGVHVFPGKNGPWTTVDLLNAAGGLIPSKNEEVVEVL